MTGTRDLPTGQQVRAEYRKWLLLKRRESRQADNHLPPEIVDKIAGDLDGLMHIDKITAPLQVKIPIWPDRPPLPALKDVLYLDWRPVTVPESEYQNFQQEDIAGPPDVPDDQFPLERAIPLQVFENYEGKFEFRYRVQAWNAPTQTSSDPAPVTIDRTRPLGPPPSFVPLAVIAQDGPLITTELLEQHSGLRCEIPDLVEDKKESVLVALALLASIPDDFPEAGELAFVGLLPADRNIVIPKDKVIALGSRKQYLAYVLFDKAGNRSDMSLPTTLQVALGALPADLKAPEVPLAADGLIDRADGATPTQVRINEYTNWTRDDGIVVKWGTDIARTAVGTHLPFPLLITVPWTHMRAEYDFDAGGAQSTEVDYIVLRGDHPTSSPGKIDVDVDLDIPGPDNPDPEPTNPALGLVRFESFSGSATDLTMADVGEPATGHINLPQTLLDVLETDDKLTLYWNGEPVTSSPYLITGSEVADVEIPFEIPWADIEKTPVMDDLPMHYTLTRDGFVNPQESQRTHIDVVVEVVDLPETTFPDREGTYPLNCNALIEKNGKWGIRVHIPPSDYLKEGETVTATWQTYDKDGTTPIPDTFLSEDITVDPQQESNGIDWFIEYETYLKPTYDADQYGWGETSYSMSVRGTTVSSEPERVMIAVFEGAGQHCTIPRPIP
ncbi:hypothetical protein J3P91_20230 [Pseudomonas sp. Z4-7]|uniref:hypothetical protein n=1 Tax=Pseudomonas sp. Z4-7 TaxID=2817413 RepID=UPI003DA80C07